MIKLSFGQNASPDKILFELCLFRYLVQSTYFRDTLVVGQRDLLVISTPTFVTRPTLEFKIWVGKLFKKGYITSVTFQSCRTEILFERQFIGDFKVMLLYQDPRWDLEYG